MLQREFCQAARRDTKGILMPLESVKEMFSTEQDIVDHESFTELNGDTTRASSRTNYIKEPSGWLSVAAQPWSVPVPPKRQSQEKG